MFNRSEGLGSIIDTDMGENGNEAYEAEQENTTKIEQNFAEEAEPLNSPYNCMKATFPGTTRSWILSVVMILRFTYRNLFMTSPSSK
jgi:hypothetical protein